ncbi:MAG: flavin reductase family protein [Blastocatellia bacterium]|nr:flavin reductase family protein [Blastocatellia bacterium]
MPIDQDEFRNALSRFASGVTVVTTKDAAGKFHGITVSAFSSVSLDPPLILICIERATVSHYAFEESGLFVVNFLSDRQLELSERFASPVEDKFDGVDFSFGEFGIPILLGSLVNLECRIRNIGDGGDHTIFIADVESATINDGDPLLYFRSDYRQMAE